MSGISHDIRTPLTSIKGYLKLIQETTDEKEKQKYYSIVEYRLDALESMLEDMRVKMIHNLVQNVLKHGCDYFEIKGCNHQIYFMNRVIHSENIEVDRLFDRFYQADLSRHQNSTGLGLSIVKQIVEMHGWNISASVEGNQLSIIIDVK